MTAQPISWGQLADLFTMLAHVYRDEGRTELPAYAAKPTADEEEACDAWCRRMYFDLEDSPLPPPEVRPWVLARTICVAALARRLAGEDQASPGPYSRSLVERLIDEWHATQKECWKQMFFHNPY